MVRKGAEQRFKLYVILATVFLFGVYGVLKYQMIINAFKGWEDQQIEVREGLAAK